MMAKKAVVHSPSWLVNQLPFLIPPMEVNGLQWVFAMRVSKPGCHL